MSHRTLAKEAIADILRKAVLEKSLPEGAVLLEGPIATLFNSSRTPVKQALAALEAEGLVRRFSGRGLLAGTEGEPLRVRLTPEMLNLSPEGREYPKTFAWEKFYYDFEKTVILHAVYGTAHINELALSRHYRVSRTVAGDILNRGAEMGIVSRDEKSRWFVNPLDERRFRDLYEVRGLLEPAALRTAVEEAPTEFVEGLRSRILAAGKDFPEIEGARLDELEKDLHIDLLGWTRNVEIMEGLRRTHCVLVAGKHIQQAIRGLAGIDAFMGEHLEIVDAVLQRDPQLAMARLSAHLLASSRKAAERIEAFRNVSEMKAVSYLVSQ
ncbi:GntR family transcriptional regulator [Azospirillum argentinense]|uniref:FCD domain-containing protein n=1 Tax=Azospirillum brasilense TaxID=192 RepID=A0A4D8QB98_AZOBR|nr:GntR family transcriptional regulator [Azospirillum argentinense]QCO06333.1 FCD domain-containing protein [Azospirillum argentinense]